MPKRRSTRSHPSRPAGRRILARYRLDEQIAIGGMAEVWRGEDETLDRPVAVKLLHQHLLPDAASRTRFETEARLAASLSHPGIVTVYDVFVSEDEAAIVLEFVPGEGLNDVIARRGPLPEEEAVELAAQVGDALEHAHRRGVIHRDVKPENILVAPDGHARLVDFGIARVASDTAQRLTLAGTTFGTLRYMAPEQLAGEAGDARTDVFGLGTTLYAMLSGRPPFEADAPAALIRQQRARPPAIRRVAPRVMNVIWDALDADPASRPSSAEEFAARLRDTQSEDEFLADVSPVLDAAPAPPARSGAARAASGSAAGGAGSGGVQSAGMRSEWFGSDSGASDRFESAGVRPNRLESADDRPNRLESADDRPNRLKSAGVGPNRLESAGVRPNRFQSAGIRSGAGGGTAGALSGLGLPWDALRRQPIGGLALLLVALLIVGAVIASARGGPWGAGAASGPKATVRASEDARVAIVGNVAEGAGADNTLPVGQYENFLYRSLIRFEPDWTPMRRVVRIELQLQTTGGIRVSRGSSPSTVVRRNVQGAWTEGSASQLTTRNSVTWASKPQTTAQGQVRFDGPLDDNRAVLVDITELYKPFLPRNLGGQGAVNLGVTLQAASDDGQTADRTDTNEFVSSEGGNGGPQLIVTYERA